MGILRAKQFVVNFSILFTILYMLPSISRANDPGDVNGDGQVCIIDYQLLLSARNQPADGPDDPRDIDGDGTITVLDARKLILLCDQPRCVCSEVPQNEAPTANAGSDRSLTLTQGQTEISVTLDGSGSSDSDGVIVSFVWSGTPDPDDTAQPEVTLGAGTHTFTLAVIDDDGDSSDQDSVTITISEAPNQAPVADAGEDQTHTLAYGEGQLEITLDGSLSHDDDGTIEIYTWSGSPDPDDEMEPTLLLEQGTYEFALVVTDDDGAESEPDTTRITVNPPDNQRPVADAGTDITVFLPLGFESTQVTLDGSDSYDPEGSDLSFAWSGDPDPENTEQAVVSLGSGVHTFTLVVTDEDELSSAPVQVTVTVNAEDAGNPPELILSPLEYTVQEKDELEFTVTAHDPDSEAVTITMSPMLKNSSFSASPEIDATGDFSFSPDYTQAGDYALLIKARDPIGNTASLVAQIHVANLNRSPWLTVEPETCSVDEGSLLSVKFDAGDPDNDSVNLSVNGLPERNAIFLPVTGTLTFAPDYDQAGEYVVTCMADDGTADPITRSVYITVNDVPDGSQQTSSLDLKVDEVQSPTLLKSARITGTVNADSAAAHSRLTAAVITGVNPASAMPGETLDVYITGETTGDYATNFDQNISHADFGKDIRVNGLVINGPGESVANITVDANADIGNNEVRIITNLETAVAIPAFSIIDAVSTISGVVTDPDTGLPVAGAIVTLQGTDISAVSNADGSFTLAGALSGDCTLIINAADHELILLNIDAQSGALTDLGNIETSSIVYDPDAPPAATLASVVNRGLGVSDSSLTVDEAKQLIIDTILTIGGSEAGVLDEYGNQLNPLVDGNGLVSLKNSGVDELALQLIAGDSRTLGEILYRYLSIFNYNENSVPQLSAVLAAIQNEVDRAWLSPTESSGLFVVLFNQRRQLLGNPPQVNLDTPLNALQSYIMVTSLLGFTYNTLNAVEEVTYNYKPVIVASSGLIFSDMPLKLLTAQIPSPSHAGYGDIYTVGWDMVFSAASPDFAGMIKDGAVEVCKIYTTPEPPPTCGNGTLDPTEECDGDPGCTSSCDWAVKPTPPGCSEMASLIELLFDDQGDAATGASERFSEFFMSEGATRENAERIKAQYQSSDFQDAWEESKKDARALGKLEALTEFGASFVMDGLAKMAGDIVNSLIAIQVDLIIETLQPDPPMIYKVEQLPDPTIGELTNTVRVTFRRSLKDKGDENGENQKWFYELWRQKGGKVARVTSGRVRKPEQGPGPRPTDDPNTLIFYDYEVPEGSVMYYIRAVRMIGPVIADPDPTAFDTVLQMAGGLFPLDFATPGGTTVMSGDTLKMMLDPVSQIIKGIQIQKSKFSDPDVIYVNLKPRPPSPPANLASAFVQGRTYMSIPALNQIFSVEDGDISLAVEAGFKTPHQAGLAADRTGNLYSDNSASDHQYGGRIFKFDYDTMGRSLVGTINYYSFLLGYAHPVMVQTMTIGPSPYGEALYIADAMDNRITRLQLPESLGFDDMSRNVSRNYIKSDKFSFGPDTGIVFRGDGTLFITQADNILSVPYGGEYVEPLFDDSWAPTPFDALSGIAIDEASNLYVSDAVQNTITQLPFGSYMAGSALKGYDDIDLKKLTIARGYVRPSQLQLSHNRRGLTFIDANGLHSVNFGMSGQITDISGNPLIGAKIVATDTVPAIASISDGDGIYVLPDLVSGTKNVVDVTIRYDNRTYSERVILDPFKHNVMDFIFDPKTPPAGTDPLTFSMAAATNMVNLDLDPGSIHVISEQVTVPKALPATATPATEDYFPRAHIMTPADKMVVSEGQISVAGFLTDDAINEAFVLLNGERVSATVQNGEIEDTVNLAMGENTIALGAKLSGARGELVAAMSNANETARAEAAALLPHFGSVMGEAGSLAGKSARAQLEDVPEEYRPSAEVAQRAALVEEAATAASSQLFQSILPDDNTMAAIVERAAEFDSESRAHSEGVAQGAAEPVVELALAAQANVSEARAELGNSLPHLQSIQSQYDVELNNINTFLGSQTGAAAITTGAQAFASSNNVMFNNYSQYRLPDTLVANEAVHSAQTLRDNIDAALASNEYSSDEEAALTSFRNLVIEADEDTQALQEYLSTIVGEAIASSAMIQGMQVDDMCAAISDSSVPDTLHQAAADFNTEAQIAAQSLPSAKLPRNDHLTALDVRASSMVSAAQASGSRISIGFSQVIQNRVARSNYRLESANSQFGQARASLEISSNNVADLRAQVESLPPKARPAAFTDIADDYAAVHASIHEGLGDGQLPLAAQIGSPRTGDKGAIYKRQGQMDEMFTVISKPVQVRRAETGDVVAYRKARGFDTVISGRLTDSDTGYPVSGLELGVPGMSRTSSSTDQDGVFQVQIDNSMLKAKCEEMNALIQARHDTMMSVISSLSSGGGTLSANEGLAILILESTKIQDTPPAALAQRSEIVSTAAEIERRSTIALADVEAGRPLDNAQILEIQNEIGKLAVMATQMQAVIETQHNVGMSIIANIQ